MAEEEKVRTKTEDFKARLQAVLAEKFGIKVSKQKAWDIFKAMAKAPFETVLANYDAAGRPAIHYGEKHKELELPLAGIGTYAVITTGKAEEFKVTGRLYLSSAIQHNIRVALGFEDDSDGGDEAVAADEAPASEAPVAGSDIDLDL